jgi:hypothetical protein
VIEGKLPLHCLFVIFCVGGLNLGCFVLRATVTQRRQIEFVKLLPSYQATLCFDTVKKSILDSIA